MAYNTFTINILKAVGLDPTRMLPRQGTEPKQVLYSTGRPPNYPVYQLTVFVMPKLNSRRIHRFYAICPCGGRVPVGRLEQHWKQSTKHGGTGWRRAWR